MRQRLTTIQGDRVLLRPFQEGDAEESARVWTPELRYMYGGSRTAPGEPTVESRQRMIERIVTGGEHHFAIEADGRYIGFAALKVAGDEDGNASYRIGIENPEYWGRGHGTEVARLMLRYAFETLALHRVHLRVAAYNTRARRCYQKAGFRTEGVLRQSFQVDGEWQDDVLMGILREEWEAMRGESGAEAKVVSIRSYRPSDYEALVELWRGAGFHVDERDNRQGLQEKLIQDPGLFLVAETVERIVGTAVGSWDGRRSWVFRVAVAPAFQRRGIGRRLMRQMEGRLTALGARSAGLLVMQDNEPAIRFYEQLEYETGGGVAFMMKWLTGKGGSGDGRQCD